MEIQLKRKVVFEGSSEGSWGSAPWYQFLTKKEIKRDQDECDVDVYVDSDTNSDAMDIPIEDMKALIQKAEDAGANYIQIDWHCDHQEYDVYGSFISRITEEELAETKLEKEKKKEEAKQAKIKELESQIRELKK